MNGLMYAQNSREKMIKCITLIAAYLVCVWPALAGCNNQYTKPGSSGTWAFYGGSDILPFGYGPNDINVMAFNLPSFIKIQSKGLISAAGISTECGIPVEQLRIYTMSSDCNDKALISIGDANIMYFQKIVLSYTNAPAGVYSFQIRTMSPHSTVEQTITAVIEPNEQTFILKPCK